MPSFYIIDGHAQIFRAYYAPFRDLSSPTGQPVKAPFVFTQMLLNLVKTKKPDYLAMVIDTGGPDQFRKIIFPQYKANRQSPPPDFKPQEELILKIVRDAGVPIFSKPCFEADDLIATFALRLEKAGFDVVIVSKDKDLRQLLTPHVSMYDVQNDRELTVDQLPAEYGHTAAQAIDVQTLMGDPTDNVPGIPGVGEKTAVKLINQYKTIPNLLAHTAELTPKLRENFEKNAAILDLSRSLVTLKNDVEIEFHPDQCEFRGFNRAGLEKNLSQLGFTTLLKRFLFEVPTKTPEKTLSTEMGLFGPIETDAPAASNEDANLATSENCAYTRVDTVEKLQQLVEELQKQPCFAFDTETDALGPMCSNLVGMSFSWEPEKGYYVPVQGPLGETVLSPSVAIPLLKPLLEDPAIGKVGHNIKYDLLTMRQAGVHIRGIRSDTLLAAFLADGAERNQYNIDSLARDFFHLKKIATDELIGTGKKQISMNQVPVDRVVRYAAEDADVCWRLHQLLSPKLLAEPSLQKLHDQVEVPLIEVLCEMEYNGVAIDRNMLSTQSQELKIRAEVLREKIIEAAGCDFNPDSPKQLAEVLFDKIGLKPVRRNKTGPSTDADVLERLSVEHRVPRLILDYRTLVKLINTYLDALVDYVNPKTGRIHGSFNMTGAATGRLSMSDPNLQNIPIRGDEGARIRLAFVPQNADRDVLITADYSQIELRVLAHFTQEPALLKAFNEGEDIHTAVACEVFGTPRDQVTRDQRSQAKVVNFGIIYGISAMGLAQRIEGLTISAARDLILAYNKRFPSIAKFMDQCVLDAHSRGYVETLLGRRRRIPQLKSGVLAQRNTGERMAINTVVQGSAADLIKVAMLNIHKRIKSENWKSKMLLQVHDELIFETPQEFAQQEAAWIKHEMETAIPLNVKIQVEAGWGKNWQEGKEG